LDLKSIVTDLKQERDRLDRAIAALNGLDSTAAVSRKKMPLAAPASANGHQRRGLTPAGRKRLSEAMKKRWAGRRKKGA
jgi:hypothetical protein